MADIELRFLSDEAFIQAVASEFSSDDSAEVGKPEVVSDPTDLGFDFSIVFALVTLVSELFFEGPIVPALRHAIRRTKPRRVRIESPFGTVTFEPSDDMSDDELRALMQRLVASL